MAMEMKKLNKIKEYKIEGQTTKSCRQNARTRNEKLKLKRF